MMIFLVFLNFIFITFVAMNADLSNTEPKEEGVEKSNSFYA